MRQTVRHGHIFELPEWLNDGFDPAERLKKSLREMMDWEPGGDLLDDSGYEDMAEMIGRVLSDSTGRWVGPPASEVMAGLKELQHSGLDPMDIDVDVPMSTNPLKQLARRARVSLERCKPQGAGSQ